MIKLKLFNSKSGLFSEKEYKKEIKRENEFLSKVHKDLKKEYKKLEKKRRIKEKEIKRQLPKQKKLKTINNKQIKVPTISVKIPTIKELEKHLYNSSDKYDQKIKRIKELHEKLTLNGLTENGFKEYRGEGKIQRKIRIKKINKLHKELINEIEKNKEIEKGIEFLEKELFKRKRK